MAGLPILQGVFPAGDLYAQALSTVYRTDWRILDPDLSQEREPEIWERIQRDGKIAQAIHQRCSAVAGGEWSVQPASDDPQSETIADIVSDALGEIHNFRESRKKLAHAIFRGRAYAYIEGERRTIKLGEFPARSWWIPKRLRDIDKRRVQIVPRQDYDEEGNLTLGVRRQVWSIPQMKWVNLADTELKSLLEVVWGSEEGNFHYYGKPLLESLFFLWWAKMECLTFGLSALERTSGGMLAVALDPENHPGGEGTDSESIRDAYLDELKKARSDHAFVYSKGDDLQFLTGGEAGQSNIHEFLQYLDSAILSTALGATLPFGGGDPGVGSLARAEGEREVSDGFLQYDRDLLDEHLTRKLVKQFIDLNWSNFQELGLDPQKLPKFTTTQQPREDPNSNIAVISQALQAGLDIKREECYTKLGLTPPGKGDEIVEGMAQDAMMGGGGGFPFRDQRDIKLREGAGQRFQ